MTNLARVEVVTLLLRSTGLEMHLRDLVASPHEFVSCNGVLYKADIFGIQCSVSI